MKSPRRAALCAGLLLGLLGSAQAAPQHAITLYDEAPKYPANFKHFDFVNADAPQGGTLRLSSAAGFDSLNPFIPKGNSAPQLGLIYDTLTFHSLDEPFTEYGLLAEKIEKDPNHRFVRFYLRPEARFQDGTPVTAEDVVFTFETLMKDGDPMYRNYYADVDKVVAEDKLRVRFDFKHGDNRELPLVLGQISVLPKHWWATRDFSKTNMEPPLGSGPYRISKVDAGRSIRYERMKNWWGDKLAVNRGFNNFGAVVVDIYRDSNVALEAFKAGQFDFNDERIAKNWATAYDSPAVRDGRIVREEPVNGNPVGHAGLRLQPPPRGVPRPTSARGDYQPVRLRMDQQAAVLRLLPA
jgi:ABC-type oligopeptide transport system, periplasmic component